jgi:hypothetical protein
MSRTLTGVPEASVTSADVDFEVECYCKMCRQTPQTPKLQVPILDLDSSVEEFLSKLKLQEYLSVFQTHRISSADLGLLTRQDLVDMNIPTGPRTRILKALADKTQVSLLELSPISFCSSGRIDASIVDNFD